MKRYIINSKNREKFMNRGGAGPKATADIFSIATQCGLVPFNVFKSFSKNKFTNAIWYVLGRIRASNNIERGSSVLFQYPEIHPIIMNLILPFYKKFHLVILIHDINSIRFTRNLSKTERKVLSRFDEIIVHTESMKQYLKMSLPKKIKYHVLGCFPYIADMDTSVRLMGNNICFAGNISKSLFLKEFITSNKDINIYLYGVKSEDLDCENAFYQGSFDPNEIIGLKGSWGLVWDGETTNGCSGLFGEYYKLIAPHKFSLYLMCGMPVIVWSKSAMAEFVRKNDIGIVVDDICLLSKKISKVTEEDYERKIHNVQKLAKEVISSGNQLTNILSLI
jgi:glycosyltransferase involved in cell wall biosynthesis